VRLRRRRQVVAAQPLRAGARDARFRARVV